MRIFIYTYVFASVSFSGAHACRGERTEDLGCLGTGKWLRCVKRERRNKTSNPRKQNPSPLRSLENPQNFSLTKSLSDKT